MENRLYREDCKSALQKLLREEIQVDLIYLDPPFKSSRIYNILFKRNGGGAQQKAFHDLWSYTDQTRKMISDFEHSLSADPLTDPAVKSFLGAWFTAMRGGTPEDRQMVAYLVYMTERLLLLRRLLKPRGCLYFHCDPTAGHYVKVILDGLFGSSNFKNEIVWIRRAEKHNLARSHMGRIHDTLFYYGREDHQYTPFYLDYTKEYKKKGYKHEDQRGYYSLFPATNEAGGNKPYVFRGIERAWRFSPQRMQQLYDDGLLVQLRPGSPFRYKKYLDDAKGVPLQDVWEDIPPARGKEHLGYPTQKPLKLLERIIQASSSPGDLVLDPFCGCGTTVSAAQGLERRWIGIDISGYAVEEIQLRLKQDYAALPKQHYQILEGAPETLTEYQRLDPYQKQDWLIRMVGGFPNPKKSGDGGIDGELTLHLGFDAHQNDRWGKMIFSVKTGAQRSPALVRELIGAMRTAKAQLGGLIIDAEPTPDMESVAQKQGEISYQYRKELPPGYYPMVQILTARDIIDGATFSTPPTHQDVKFYRTQEDLFGRAKP